MVPELLNKLYVDDRMPEKCNLSGYMRIGHGAFKTSGARKTLADFFISAMP
jgi:hypothetical protein